MRKRLSRSRRKEKKKQAEKAAGPFPIEINLMPGAGIGGAKPISERPIRPIGEPIRLGRVPKEGIRARIRRRLSRKSKKKEKPAKGAARSVTREPTRPGRVEINLMPTQTGWPVERTERTGRKKRKKDK